MIIKVLNTYFKAWYLQKLEKTEKIPEDLRTLGGNITNTYTHWNNFRNEE